VDHPPPSRGEGDRDKDIGGVRAGVPDMAGNGWAKARAGRPDVAANGVCLSISDVSL
jgi:hypothetical protein